MELNPELCRQLVQELSELPAVEQIVLFGSRSRGDADERSDIDIAIKASIDEKSVWNDIYDKIEKLDTLLCFDIVALDTLTPTLRETILREGKILYERSQSNTSPD